MPAPAFTYVPNISVLRLMVVEQSAAPSASAASDSGLPSREAALTSSAITSNELPANPTVPPSALHVVGQNEQMAEKRQEKPEPREANCTTPAHVPEVAAANLPRSRAAARRSTLALLDNIMA